MGSWQQCRRLSGDHCRHSPSNLVYGLRGPGGEAADSMEADSLWAVFWRSAVFDSPTDGWPCDLWAVQDDVVGTVRHALWLRSGEAWQQCRASPEISRRYGSL